MSSLRLQDLRIRLSAIKSATNNFSEKNCIGEGGFGKVYKGKLFHSEGHTTVAIKVLYRLFGQGDSEFWTEVMLLSRYRHPNVASLLGFCDEGTEKILVYEYASLYSLDKYIDSDLTWVRRLKICIGAARGLAYLHNPDEGQERVLHRDMKSSNILLDDNWKAMVADFGLSKIGPANQEDSFLVSSIVGTTGYCDPSYKATGLLTKESDVYSFGVVLFEVICGKLCTMNNRPLNLTKHAREHYEQGTMKNIILGYIKDEINTDSMNVFTTIAYQCTHDDYEQRPLMTYVVRDLENALQFQNGMTTEWNELCNGMDQMGTKFADLQISFEEIVSATNNFARENCIGVGGFGKVYKGKLYHHTTVAIKVLYRIFGQGDPEFWTQVMLLSRYRHPNVASLLGFCDEGTEKILVYEYASHYSLDKYIDSDLTWVRRLKICIGAARGLAYLHNPDEGQERVLHRDMKSSNILLDDNWKAMVADFGLSKIGPANPEDTFLVSQIVGTAGYCDPSYMATGLLTKESDVYSFGVVLFEVFCGKLCTTNYKSFNLTRQAREHYEQGKMKNIIHGHIEDEINTDSMNLFTTIAYQCTHDDYEERPLMTDVVRDLENALHFQMPIKFAHLQIRLEEIVSATSNFAKANLIKQGRYEKVYNGRILHSGEPIDITAWRYGKHVDYFWTEISMLVSLEHKNIASIFGFCFENDENIIIYKNTVHGSLDQLVNDETLTWFRRLHICLGVARALSYIHYDVIHCNINSSKIFVDKDGEVRVFGFELSTKYPVSWSHRLLFSQDFDKMEYIDPMYMKTGVLTPKYDVYSFGVILFEVLGVRKAIIGDGGVNESVSAKARQLYQEKKLDEIIDNSLRRQMDSNSLTIFLETAFNCLKEEPRQRPTMDQVVKELEDALELQWKRENIEHSAAADEDILSNSIKTKHVELLRIQLSDIKSATDDFNQRCCIGSGGYGMVYKADLEHLDIQTLSSTKGKNKDELPKRRSTVAIKRMLNRQDEQDKQGFWAEIELLTSCKHQNIVSLLGFSSKDREMILVYEFLINGSLDEYLGSAERKINLTWNQRVRICLDIAEGLKYLHTSMEGKPRIIHRDIKSANILLDKDWNAKIADFGLSKFHPANQLASTIQSKNVAGTEVYLDPEYLMTGKYKKESDIYSFGVVLFEILSGSLAYNAVYLKENNLGLAPIARRRFNEQTLKELIDPAMMEEDDEHCFTLNRGPNQDSFDAISKIAYQCLAETQAKRPTVEVIIKELHNALNLQGETTVLSKFQFSDMVRATENFASFNRIAEDAYCMVYKAKLDQFESESSSPVEEKNTGKKPRNFFAKKNFLSFSPIFFSSTRVEEKPRKCITVAIKVISSRQDVKKEGLCAEIEMRTRYKHPNIVSLLGFCDKGHEMILVYEHASNRSLDDYLRHSDNLSKFSWKQRLNKCLDIARGLNHLHTKMGSKQTLVHGDIKSANILLSKDSETKIAYFGLSNLRLANQDAIITITSDRKSPKVYCDPECEKTGKLVTESDIYSFGVILFEIFCGRLAYDPVYVSKNEKGLAPIARRCFDDGTIKKMMDPTLLEETDEDIFTSSNGTNQDSVDTFLKTAYQCVGETQAERPRMKAVIEELERALDIQENLVSNLHISLKDMKLATQNFGQERCIGSGRDWKAYKGEIPLANAGPNEFETIVAKRWNSMSGQGNHQFRTELDILFKRKHENIIGLVGFCSEMNETIIVYKHASKGSLHEYLSNADLTWLKRLKISIDVASGLEFLHEGDVTLKKVVHRGIKSASILLTGDWKAKISNLELSSLDSLSEDAEHVIDNAYGTSGYLDPEYAKSGLLTKKSDIYAFGVILFEVLCGKLAWAEGCMDHSQSLGPLAKRRYEEEKLNEIVFEGIKKQIVPQSFSTFVEIAYRCIHDDGNERPDASEVVIQLKKALEFQEEDEIWEPKLPRNYKEIIAMTKQPDIYHNSKKKDLYKMLSEGIFLQNDKVWFSLSSTGKGNAMISATMFSCENHRSHKWRSIQKSIARFHRVAKMMDLSKLKIQIKIDTTFLSSDVVYGVHLIFKFCNPVKSSKSLMYVNMKYNMGSENLHAYFAKLRDEDGWMMIELCRFLNKKENMGFEISLESFSRCYCENGGIYIQGLEFKAIDNIKQEEIENLMGVKQVPKSNLNVDKAQQLPMDSGETSGKSENTSDRTKLLLLNEVNGKIHLMLCAKLVLYNLPNMKPFHFKLSSESRFQDVVELPREQVLRIKYKFEKNMLSQFTEYSCYLVFKLSESCCGLHCPVKVHDLLFRKSKETQILYFRSPASLNQHYGNWVPKQRKDGWMEVMVWNFNSKYKSEKTRIPMNLQLVTYEGTMSGLIIYGLDIRPR